MLLLYVVGCSCMKCAVVVVVVWCAVVLCSVLLFYVVG